MARAAAPSPRIAGLLLALLLVPAVVPTAAAAPSLEDRRREALADFRAKITGAVDRYEAAHANFTAATNDSAREAARQEMVAAGHEVGSAFLSFERGHGNESSLNAFMQGEMPTNFYRGFERNVVLLRALMVEAGSGTPATRAEVQAREDAVLQALDRTAACLPDGCGGTLSGAAAQSFVVLLREGLEAILVVGAIVAYLRKSNREDKVPLVGGGVAAGVLASVGLWGLLRGVSGAASSASARASTIVEGASMLLAAAVLFYVSYWLLSKAEAERWQAYLDGRVQDSLAQDRTWVLALVGFLAVFREGVETALFMQALSAQGASAAELGLGAAVAAVVLAALYVAIHRLSVRVPLRKFFLATSALLYALSLRFTGMGVFEFQEGGLVATTPLPGLIAFLETHPLVQLVAQDLLGFTATLEVLVAQAVLVGALVAGAAWSWVRKPRAEAAGG